VNVEEFKSGTVRANGLEFAFLEAGSGPLVLCLHGFPDHARTFRFQLGPLARAGFRAVAPYQRGYSPTAQPSDGSYQSAALALDAVALIEALGYQKAAVFGHDWGAVAAFGAAVLAPERIEKLVTAAVPHGPAFLQALMGNYEQQRRSWYMFFFQHPLADVAVEANDFAFIEKLWRDWSPDWKYDADEMESLKRTFRSPGVLSAALGYYRCTLNAERQRPELAEVQARISMAPIEVPTLAFHGARDGCIGVDLLSGMEPLFPQGLKLVIVPEAGHFVHQEAPQRINDELLAFLAR
jgi:pimeloyl-ACP methyl ester carboxylesterase